MLSLNIDQMIYMIKIVKRSREQQLANNKRELKGLKRSVITWQDTNRGKRFNYFDLEGGHSEE
jgi:hypothetical protein